MVPKALFEPAPALPSAAMELPTEHQPVERHAPARPATEPSAAQHEQVASETAAEESSRVFSDEIQRYQRQIQRCISDELLHTPGTVVRGKLMVHVDPTGRVSSIGVEGDLKGGRLQHCLERSAASWRFRPGSRPETIEVKLVGGGAP